MITTIMGRQYETRYKIPEHILTLTERPDKNYFQVDENCMVADFVVYSMIFKGVLLQMSDT